MISNKPALLILDVESTGLDPRVNGLLEIAAQLHVDGKKVSEFVTKISNTSLVDLGALKVNKIAAEALRSYGTDLPIAANKLVDWLLTANKLYSNITLVGHNVNFDRRFIEIALENNGFTNLAALIPYRVIDTASIALFLKASGVLDIDKINSASLYDALGLKYDKSSLHSAVNDVELTAAAYYKMIELVKGLTTKSAFTKENLYNLSGDPRVALDSPNLSSLTQEPIMPNIGGIV